MKNYHEFLPSVDLTKKYWKIYNERLKKELPKEEIKETELMLKELAKARGCKKPTKEEIKESMRKILKKEFIGEIVSYTKHKSIENEENLKGLVVKLTEKNSFNKEFLDGFSQILEIDASHRNFFSELYKEFFEYVKNNTIKINYAKLRVKGNEIEFYDFRKYKPLNIDTIPKNHWMIT